MIRVFLDASCWVAAAGSPDGGSAGILKLAQARYLSIGITQRVFHEAERNIKDKLGEKALLRYYEWLDVLDLEVIPPPTPTEESRWNTLVAPKDCHVLAAAYHANFAILVSLDKKHIVNEQVKRDFPVQVMDTKEFLQWLHRQNNKVDTGGPVPKQ
jgi:predicted nucleic acid-binding protein